MYIYPEFFGGIILGFTILFFGHLFAIYLLNRTYFNRKFYLKFHFPLRFPFEIVEKKKKEEEESKSEKEFREHWFKHNTMDPFAYDVSEVKRNVNSIIERFKEKYNKNTTQE